MATGVKRVGPFGAAVAAVLRSRQGKRGWSKTEVAKRADLPTNSTNGLLNGKAPIRLDDFLRLCAALEVQPTDVIAEALADMAADGNPPT